MGKETVQSMHVRYQARGYLWIEMRAKCLATTWIAIPRVHLERGVVAATEKQVLGSQGVPCDDIHISRMCHLIPETKSVCRWQLSETVYWLLKYGVHGCLCWSCYCW